jgi:hypothetical protein
MTTITKTFKTEEEKCTFVHELYEDLFGDKFNTLHDLHVRYALKVDGREDDEEMLGPFL